jgi:hypothetical protein
LRKTRGDKKIPKTFLKTRLTTKEDIFSVSGTFIEDYTQRKTPLFFNNFNY